MRYPRPQSPDKDGTVLPAAKKPSPENRDEGLPAATPKDLNQSEGQDHLVVERRLQTGLTALQRVVASYEAEEPLPRGLSGVVDDNFFSTCRGNDEDRDESVPSQGLETGSDKLEATTTVKGSGHNTRDTPSTPGGPEALTGSADTTRPTIHGNSENEAGQVSETPTKSTSQSTTVPSSSRSQESRESFGSTGGSKPRSSSKEGNHSADASNSDRSEHGGTPSSLSKQENGSPVKSNDAEESLSSHAEVPGLTSRNKDAERAPAAEIPDEDIGKPGNGGIRENLHISPTLCEREGHLLRAVDLENGAQEARRFTSVTAATCKDLSEKEVALLR